MKKNYNINDVCCVVITYNGGVEAINNILNLGNFMPNILVVDNGSCDQFQNSLKNISSKLMDLIINPQNVGIATALNQAWRYAYEKKLSLFLTLDQDTKITFSIINDLILSMNSNENIVSIGPRYYGSKYYYLKEEKLLITSGNMTLTSIIAKVGGFWDELFIDGVDIDFSYKLRSYGFKIFSNGREKMQHKIGFYEKSPIFKIKYLAHSPLRYYYIFRNTIFLYKKYHKELCFDCFRMMVSLFIRYFLKILFIEKNRLEKLKYVSKGIKDGIRTQINVFRQN